MPAHRAPTRREMIAGGARDLSEAGVESARLEAERLVSHALGISRDRLALAADEPLAPTEVRSVEALLSRRVAGEPLQHIEGTVQFRDLELLADRRALIPRPETEQLVDQVIRWARESSASDPLSPARNAGLPVDSVLDVGTGSGAIALALVTEGVAARVVALDISEVALEQARDNCARMRLGGSVELRRCGAKPYDALRPGELFDAIVSNPPYIREPDLPGLAPEVRDHDPVTALAGGTDGLDVIRTVIGGARARLRTRGALFLEIGAEQGDEVRGLLRSSGPWSDVDIRPDLAGRDRFAVARV